MNYLILIRPVRLGALLTTLALIVPLHPARAQLAEAWMHRDTSVSSNALDRAVQIVMDADGDIVVSGITSGGISGTDIVTIKYSGAIGAALWQQRYNGPDGYDDEPAALAVDPGGDILITGSSRTYGSDAAYYTAKYSGRTGHPLWEQRDERPRGGVPKAIAVDSEGNAVVTGWFSGQGTRTVKYEGTTGRLLWSVFHEGTTYEASAAGAVAVDGEGNFLVTTAIADGASNLVMKLALKQAHYPRPMTKLKKSVKMSPSNGLLRSAMRRGHRPIYV